MTDVGTFAAVLAATWTVILLLLALCIKVGTGHQPKPSRGLFLIPLFPATAVALLYQFSGYLILAIRWARASAGLLVLVASLIALLLAPMAAAESFLKWLRTRRAAKKEVRRALEQLALPLDNPPPPVERVAFDIGAASGGHLTRAKPPTEGRKEGG